MEDIFALLAVAAEGKNVCLSLSLSLSLSSFFFFFLLFWKTDEVAAAKWPRFNCCGEENEAIGYVGLHKND